MSYPATGPAHAVPANEDAEHTSLAPFPTPEVATNHDGLDSAADDHLVSADTTTNASQASEASSAAKDTQLVGDATMPRSIGTADSSSDDTVGGGTEEDLTSLAQEGDVNAGGPSAASVDSDLAMVGAFSADEVQDSTLEALRTRIIETRGARAQLPAGWEEEGAMPAMPDANNDKGNQDASSSSSDSDSDSSSSSDDSSEDDQERVTMVSDYDSDDSSPAKKGSGDGPRGPTTKSELPPSRAAEMFGKLPFDEVPEGSRQDLKPLGKVHGNVQEVLVIAQAEEIQRGNGSTPNSRLPPGVRIIGGASNERQGPILDAGSLVCTQEGKVIGFIFETFGSLLSPLYSVLLPTAAIAASYKTGQDILFLPSHSTVLRPAELRASQGKASDASNVNDEEAGVEEMDFSDDEEEAEYKRKLKASKKRLNARGPGGSVEDGFTDGIGRGGKGGRGSDRGRGRGRGGARGRGERGADFGSTQQGGPSAPFPLPQRPNWQLDDPDPSSATTLSYDEPSSSTSMSSRSKPGPYESGMFTPPKSAGLPAIPRAAAEMADQSSSEAPTAVSSARTVHPLPAMPSPAPPVSASHTPLSSAMNVASGPVPTLLSSQSQPKGASSVAEDPPIASSPAFAAGPPPGAHINPLFAHQWAPQHYQQPQHIARPSHYAAGHQQYLPSQQQYAQQGWNGYQYNYQGGQTSGYQYPQYQQAAPYGGQQAHQSPYWSQQQQAPQQYGPSTPYDQQRSPYANGSGQTQGQGQQPQSWLPQQYQGGQHPSDGVGGTGNGSYDPSQGKMDFSK